MFIMKDDNIFSDKISHAILRMTETGILDTVFRQHVPTMLKTIDEGEPLKPLKLDSFMLGFIIWIIGLISAIIVFLAERYWKVILKRIRHI